MPPVAAGGISGELHRNVRFLMRIIISVWESFVNSRFEKKMFVIIIHILQTLVIIHPSAMLTDTGKKNRVERSNPATLVKQKPRTLTGTGLVL